MAIKMTNLSEKVIGVGEVTVLPGETKEVPIAFETSPILEVYKNMGLVSLSGKPTATTKAAAEKKAEEDKAKAEAEAKAAAEKNGFHDVILCEDLKEAVQVCADKANAGDAVLLSPACASWGQFDNYEQRGQMFKEYVRAL